MKKGVILMDNISGNYNTKNDEIEAVKAYLERENILYSDIYKYPDANAGDVMVRFPNNFYSLFEVKQESQERFMSKYGEYGIDFISSLVFKNGVDKDKWKKIHKPCEYREFINSLDICNEHFKWGKIYYSYSDIWLFYIQDKETKEYLHLEAYSSKKMDNINLFTYLKNNCEFAVNLKSEEQLSKSDKYDSATFYISPDKLAVIKATKDDIFHNNSIELFSDVKELFNPPEPNIESTTFVGNKNNFTFHLPNCMFVPSNENKKINFNNIKDAENAGYKPCKNCKPDKKEV